MGSGRRARIRGLRFAIDTASETHRRGVKFGEDALRWSKKRKLRSEKTFGSDNEDRETWCVELRGLRHAAQD